MKFYLVVTRNLGTGIPHSDTFGPFTLNVICPGNIGVTQTSGITSEHIQLPGRVGTFTLALISADSRCPVKS